MSFSTDGDDDEDAEIQKKIEKAFAPPTSNNNNNNNNNYTSASSHAMPSAHVESISREFRANPTKALVEFALPEDKPEEIYDWDNGTRIADMVKNYENNRRKAKEVSEVPLRRFAELIDTSINISLTNAATDPIRVYFRPDHDYTTRPFNGIGAPSAPGVAGGSAPGPAFAASGIRNNEAKDYEYAQAVRRGLNRVEVTGEFTLAPIINMGVQRSLSSLNELDPDKFKGSTLEDFLHDDEAMRQMAFLTIAHITNARIKNPSRYFKDRDESRRTAEVNDCAEKMVRSLARPSPGAPFVLVNAAKQKEIVAGNEDVFNGLHNAPPSGYMQVGRRMRSRRY